MDARSNNERFSVRQIDAVRNHSFELITISKRKCGQHERAIDRACRFMETAKRGKLSDWECVLATNPRIAIVLLSPVGLLFALPLVLWAFSFTELLGQEKCAIGSISGAEYQRILDRAGAQRWTVWPGLSNGVFWPSDNGFRGPTASFNGNLNDQLLSHVKELAGPDASANRELASGHAVMRSMGAEYVQTQELPNMVRGRAGSNIHFKYFLPQVRFAPACVLCLIWWYTTIDVTFSHDLATDRYELTAVNLQHAGLKGTPDKERSRNVPWGSCPKFR